MKEDLTIVLGAVARRFETSCAVLIQRKKTKDIAEARMVAAYLMRLLTNHSMKAVGRFLGGRDHSTVIHSCAVVGRRLESDNAFLAKLQDLIDEITPSLPKPPNSPSPPVPEKRVGRPPRINVSEMQCQMLLAGTDFDVSSNGWPDFALFQNGKIAAVIEAKRDKFDLLKPHQTKLLLAFGKIGIPAFRWSPDVGFQSVTPNGLGEPIRGVPIAP